MQADIPAEILKTQNWNKGKAEYVRSHSLQRLAAGMRCLCYSHATFLPLEPLLWHCKHTHAAAGAFTEPSALLTACCCMEVPISTVHSLHLL